VEEDGLIQLEGKVAALVFQNEETGYAVLRLETAEHGFVVAVGCIPCAAPGETLFLQGRWTRHPSYGEQFRAERAERRLPAGASAILDYLSSGVIRGIGPATARRLVDAFGDETLDVLEREPDRIAALKGVTRTKAYAWSEGYRVQTGLRRLMEFLGKHDLPHQLGILLFRRFGQLALDAIRDNPYLLAGEPYGLEFSAADRLAIALQISAEDPRRLEAGILFELEHNLGNGHSFLPRGKLLDAASRLLGADLAPLERCLDALIERRIIICESVSEEEACYLSELHHAETETAEALRMLCAGQFEPPRNLDELIGRTEAEQGISYAPQQRLAVELAARHPLLLLTGGPGTGKTTTVRAILSLFDTFGFHTALAAPTGRAAKRLSELCFREAQTIHRLLEAGYHGGDGALSFGRNADNPLPADAVIVDEASMLDILLMHALLQALKPGCRLILVGDAHQLPSVGPGNLLSDLLRCGRIPSVELTEIFRQARESAIVMNAHRVNRGEPPDLRNQSADFFFLRRRDGAQTVDTILELCKTRLPERLGIDPAQIQVLSPTRLRTAGTNNLNRLLQEALNPPSVTKRERRFGDTVFREGDRVMQTKNNYDILWQSPDGHRTGYGIYNGDIGRILQIDVPGETVTVEFDDRRAEYTPDLLGELELAYAMTVHKAQGSEYKAVILAASSAPGRLLSRSVLYTAITRARELLILVGDDDLIARMAANNRQQRRYSGLRYRLAGGSSP